MPRCIHVSTGMPHGVSTIASFGSSCQILTATLKKVALGLGKGCFFFSQLHILHPCVHKLTLCFILVGLGLEHLLVAVPINQAKVNGADWKPLHHDTAAFSQRRVGKQNITVGVSLGGTGNTCGIDAPYSSVQGGCKWQLPCVALRLQECCFFICGGMNCTQEKPVLLLYPNPEV